MRHEMQSIAQNGSKEQHNSIVMQENIVTVGANRFRKSLDFSKVEDTLYVDQRHELTQNPGDRLKGQFQPVMNHNEPIKEHGLLDWSHLDNWKSNEKRIMPRFNIMASPNGSPLSSSSKDSRSVRFPRNKKPIRQTPSGSPSPVSSSSKERLPTGVRWTKGKPIKPPISASSPRSNDLLPGNVYRMMDADLDDRLMEADESRLYNFFSPRSFDSLYPSSDVPHSSPFPLPLSADMDYPNVTRVTPLRGRSIEENRTNSVDRNWKRSNATNPSRSSPLRRFLDPFLKLKGAHVAEKVHKPKLDLIPTGISITSMNEYGLLQNKKYGSNVQALLKLTLKNGIPFFKLVENSSDILAAAVKKLPSDDDDTSLVYMFYSIHETKKKSGSWLQQNSKENSHHREYNIVGQMKISSSYHAEFSGPEKELYVERESVLYSAETTRADQKTVDSIGELAAIIIKTLSNETSGEIGRCRTTTVVLPDCVHTWPVSGLSSPLINRWRFGGSCDCGGWDRGCQFHILKTSKTPSSPDHLDLSNYQGGHKNKCSFRLVSVEDGLYSLEYDPSISLLQAFAISVSVVSSQRLAHIFQINYVPESKVWLQKPPASPVGRI